jgi:hypothetical protein
VADATTIQSFADFERTFGGLSLDFPMSYAVSDFFRTVEARRLSCACSNRQAPRRQDCRRSRLVELKP